VLPVEITKPDLTNDNYPHVYTLLPKQKAALPLFVLALALVVANLDAAPPVAGYRAMDTQTLRNQFHDPPREAGPWILWYWFDNAVVKKELTVELEEMAAAGIAGVELKCVESSFWREQADIDADLKLSGHKRLEYLSDEFMDALEHVCTEAERLGLKFSIDGGMGWPWGGTWIPPQHRTRSIAATKKVLDGPKRLTDDDNVRVPPNSFVLAWKVDPDAARHVIVESFCDLTDHVIEQALDRFLEWDVPDGKWLVGIFEIGFGGPLDKSFGWPPDPGSAEAITYHLDYLFGKLETRIGKFFGTTLLNVLTDSWEYDIDPATRYWTPQILQRFKPLAGYPLRPRLHALLDYGPNPQQVLADLDGVERTLVRENYFARATRQLNARGLHHRAQVRGRGLPRDFFEVYAHVDIPEVEMETFLPEAVWVARTLGKPIVTAEAFTFISGYKDKLQFEEWKVQGSALTNPDEMWQTNPALLRSHSNAFFARGVNRLVMAAFNYTPSELPMPGWRDYAEVHLNHRIPWWPYMNSYCDWVRRMQWVLQAGGPVADVLVYPVQPNPPTRRGPYNTAGQTQPVSAVNAVDAANGYTFVKLASGRFNSVHNGNPQLEKSSATATTRAPYDFSRLMLLDDVPTLAEVEHVAKFMEDGVQVLGCRRTPDQWTALSSQASESAKQRARLSRRLSEAQSHGQFIDVRSQPWRTTLDQYRSVRWTPEDNKLSFQHRKIDDMEIYLLMNWDNDFAGNVSFPHVDSVPEFWHADTGDIRPVGQYHVKNGRTYVPVSLAKLESLILTFSAGRERLHAVDCQNGRVAYGSDGQLVAYPDHHDSCHVTLSDGTSRDVHVDVPSAVQLKGTWSLFADVVHGIGFQGTGRCELDHLVSWRVMSGLRNYAGVVTYRTELDVPLELLSNDLGLQLELGEVYELARVWVNGRQVGTTWTPPFQLEVTRYLREGTNQLRIDVPNILKNRLEQGDYTRPSGLLGPVVLRPFARVALDRP